jgi:hypothetical protein
MAITLEEAQSIAAGIISHSEEQGLCVGAVVVSG